MDSEWSLRLPSADWLRCFRTALWSSSSCPLLFRECPEWIVPCGGHGALCCLLPRPHHCSCLVSPTVLVHQSGCLSRGPVDQYTGRGGVLDRRGDSHCGRSHERVRCKAPITSPHDLMLRKPSEVKRSVAFGGPNHSKATRQDRVLADRSTSL